MRIFTIGTVTLKQGEIKDATPLDFVRATATIPIQASLPFGWLIVGVALLAVFQSASKIITLKKRWQLALSKGVHFVCNLLLLFVTVYSHLLLVAAGLEAPFLYLYALVYFLLVTLAILTALRLCAYCCCLQNKLDHRWNCYRNGLSCRLDVAQLLHCFFQTVCAYAFHVVIQSRN